jgi:hypothetical protein
LFHYLHYRSKGQAIILECHDYRFLFVSSWPGAEVSQPSSARQGFSENQNIHTSSRHSCSTWYCLSKDILEWLRTSLSTDALPTHIFRHQLPGTRIKAEHDDQGLLLILSNLLLELLVTFGRPHECISLNIVHEMVHLFSFIDGVHDVEDGSQAVYRIEGPATRTPVLSVQFRIVDRRRINAGSAQEVPFKVVGVMVGRGPVAEWFDNICCEDRREDTD